MTDSPLKLVAVRSSSAPQVKAICSLLERHETIYPGITAWFRRRVLPEVSNGGRVVLGVQQEDELIAEAVLKLRGLRAKLCSFYVDPCARKSGVAADLLATALANVRSAGCTDIHFTIGEDGAQEHAGYFERFGFTMGANLGPRYRRGFDEWLYRASVCRADAALLRWRRSRLLEPSGAAERRTDDWSAEFVRYGLNSPDQQLWLKLT